MQNVGFRVTEKVVRRWSVKVFFKKFGFFSEMGVVCCVCFEFVLKRKCPGSGLVEHKYFDELLINVFVVFIF